MVTFYADENVDGPIVTGLQRRGIDILTIQADGRIGLAPDSLVLDRATELDRVLISQDDDLLREARKRQSDGVEFAGVIFAPKDKTAWGSYIAELELIAHATTPEEHRSQVYYLTGTH